ncbi:outer membrane beta-barrel protein [Hoeflea sp. EC-HK425]|uniref:outer membrane beta-barrel protein n=1 Tax=Hoeflea sp. EC-HK425 TaxID=2038388 RepID=UPI00125AB52E|nr:outer membrane beta-barrel protein [Hoeflea sp. EC-HK425]VVT01672.1 conserved hypothetical protein [Hoeflea sp. EC-HK425]
MRNRIKTAQTRLAVGRNGFRVSVSAICVLSALSPAASQTFGNQGASESPYQLRGTTGSSVTGTANAASTLYGALPAARPTGAISSSGVGDAGSLGATSARPTGAGGFDANASSEDLTGSIGSPTGLSQADQDYAASLARQNERVGTIDGLPLDSSSGAAELPGFAIGTLTLRPTLDQRIIREAVRFGTSKTSRTYSQTSLSGTLQSDWSRHQLSIDGTGTWQENISGTGTESPSADINARLDLDLVNDITARLGAGYSYSQESRTDPNAISGASTQSGIHELRASIGLQKNLGLLRGTTGLEVTRRMYGNATLPDGTSISADDRDTLGANLTGRIGYELSPALVPFLEASIGREKYDQRVDSTGAERSSNTYAVRAGAEVDLGEKLSGEFAAGYVFRTLDDNNLADISGLSANGELNWSPARGTDVNFGLATTLESATIAGQSGAIVYELDSTLTQQIRSDVVARLGATASYRDYDSGSGRSNQRSYGASVGLTWSVNRYLDLEADASYERTEEPGATDEETTRIGLGLKLRR